MNVGVHEPRDEVGSGVASTISLTLTLSSFPVVQLTEPTDITTGPTGGHALSFVRTKLSADDHEGPHDQ
jgi:hypothetical protein